MVRQVHNPPRTETPTPRPYRFAGFLLFAAQLLISATGETMEPAIIIPVPTSEGQPDLYGIQYNAQGIIILRNGDNGWFRVDGPIPFQVAIHITAIAQAGLARIAAMNAAGDMIGRFMKPTETTQGEPTTVQ